MSNTVLFRNKLKNTLKVMGEGLLYLLLLLSFLALFSALWYRKIYGDLGFDSILFTLRASLDGVENDLVLSWATQVLPPCLLLTGIIAAFCILRRNHRALLFALTKWKLVLFPIRRKTTSLLCLALSVALLLGAANVSRLSDYLANQAIPSQIFEEQYKDPRTTTVTFPEKKRNLIYIFMESMETSYLSKEQGGTVDYNLIPELYQLAQENINFSHNEDVGGFSAIGGDTWTIGAMVSQTAGVPLKMPPGVDGNNYGQNGSFLPGIYNLTDLLRDNGYYQALMVGSDCSFGGRKAYYEQHGIDRIYDLFTAREDGLIHPEYKIWWGYEDMHLYTYAKQEISKIAAQGQPFAFTMLTADTHHIGGFMCQLCENTYEEQYENVITCASRQIAEFIDWIKTQDFYENTTVVIVGDHPSMDQGYFSRVSDSDYSRHVYNCIINAPIEADNTQNRAFCAYDMLPTTLAAMGCTIDGDRLGLGTNLFSQTPTLLEETNGAFANEIAKNSKYYTKNFFFE